MPSFQYSKLDRVDEDAAPSSDNEAVQEEQSAPRSAGTSPCVFAFLAVILAFVSTMFGYTIHSYVSRFLPSPTTRILHCDNSSADAHANGCVFDLLTNNWVPEPCSDPATDNEYRDWVLDPERQLGAWAFFLDNTAEHWIESEAALSHLVGTRVYTTTENHLAHCAFLARRMHRLATGEIRAVAHNTFAHTKHCTSAIMEAIGGSRKISEDMVGSEFDVGVVSCTLTT